MLVRGGSPARYARRNPDSLVLRLLRKTVERAGLRGKRLPERSSRTRPGGHPESIANSPSESMIWTRKFGPARGFLYNFALLDNAFPTFRVSP
jgi:hypothetical protein